MRRMNVRLPDSVRMKISLNIVSRSKGAQKSGPQIWKVLKRHTVDQLYWLDKIYMDTSRACQLTQVVWYSKAASIIYCGKDRSSDLESAQKELSNAHSIAFIG